MTQGADVPWTKMINPQLVSGGAGNVVLAQQPEELHLNHNGDMHAGVIFSMVEMAGMGVVVMLLGASAAKAFIVVKRVELDFLARAQGKIRFSADIAPERQQQILDDFAAGGTIEEPVKVTALDEQDKPVASATVLTYIAPARN